MKRKCYMETYDEFFYCNEEEKDKAREEYEENVKRNSNWSLNTGYEEDEDDDRFSLT